MTEIYLMRHAESTMQIQLTDFVGGRQNHVELTPKGREQAIKAGTYLLRHSIHPTLVYSSPAVRAIDTARLALGVEAPILDDHFQELTHGAAEGKPRAEVYTPEAIHQLSVIGMDFKFPGGESTNEVGVRMHEGVLEVARAAKDNDVVYIATHGIAIKSLVAHLCGYDQQWIYTSIVHNVSLTHLTLENDELVLDHDCLMVDTLRG